MHEFIEFTLSFWKDWKAKVTGGALAVIITVAGAMSKVPPTCWITGSLAVYFFSSAYSTWKKERDRALKAEADVAATAAALESQKSATLAEKNQVASRPLTHAERFEQISTKFHELEPWAQQTLKFVFDNKLVNEKADISHGHGIDSPPPDALAQLNRLTGGWLIRSSEGHYSIAPATAIAEGGWSEIAHYRRVVGI